MSCQIMFSGENKKKVFTLSSAQFAQRAVMVKVLITVAADNIFKYLSLKISLDISCESSAFVPCLNIVLELWPLTCLSILPFLWRSLANGLLLEYMYSTTCVKDHL